MDPTILVVSIIGAVLTTGLIYYSLRTVFLFKSNVAARAWVYISVSAMFFGVGVAFLIESLGPWACFLWEVCWRLWVRYFSSSP